MPCGLTVKHASGRVLLEGVSASARNSREACQFTVRRMVTFFVKTAAGAQ